MPGVSRELSLAEIFQLEDYWETKILLTAVRLDVFTALEGRRKILSEYAGVSARIEMRAKFVF